MASLSQEYRDRASFLWAEASQPVAATVMEAFDLRRHPAVFVLNRHGDLVGRFVGVADRDELAGRIEAALDGRGKD